MTTFYLSTQYDIPATGLYYYTATQNPGEYEERRIRCDGLPGHNPLRSVQAFDPQAPPFLKNWHLYSYIDRSDWLEIPSGPPATTYLAFHPVAAGQPQRIWQNALQANNANPNQLALPSNTRWILPTVLAARCQQGYEQVISGGGALANNASLFWQAGRDVSTGIGDQLTRTLGSPSLSSSGDAYSGLSKFNQPYWIFQLNRVLSEGFIEGHAQSPFRLTTAASNYQVAPNSTGSWNTVLDSAATGNTVNNFALLVPDEQRAMNLLADAVIKHFSLDIIFPDIQRQTVLGWILDYFTPGSTPAQEFAFWYLHYPHWHRDLVYALQLYGVRANNQDWDTLAQIIMMNYPVRGTGLSVNDWLLGFVLRLGNQLGMTFPDWITFIVEDVLRDVRRQSGVALPCPPGGQ